MAGDLIEASTLLSYNYADATSNKNSATLFFDWDKGTSRYKGTAAITENTDGSLTFWFYDQNLEDSTATGGHVYGETYQFTWYTNNGTGIDKSGTNGQQALVVHGGPIPKGTSSYNVGGALIQNFPNTYGITPTFDAVQVPVESGAVGITDGATTVWVFRARLHPTGPKGTVLTLGNVSHYENGTNSNNLYNDSAGPTSGSLNLTLNGAQPPVITAIAPSQAAHGDVVTLTGSLFDPRFTLYFGSTPAEVLELTTTSCTTVVPTGVPLGNTTVFFSNGSLQSNSVAFTVAANTLRSGYSHELALQWPQQPPQISPPPKIVGITVTPATATVTEGQSQQFACIATWDDGGPSTTLTSAVTWAVSNVNGVGTVDPNTGLFVAQTAGTEVDVIASVPSGTTLNRKSGVVTQGTGANLVAQAKVTVAARIIVPQLSQITLTPADPEIATGSQLQMHASGLSQLGTVMYPKVTWAIQGGVQTASGAHVLNPADFVYGGTQGVLTNAQPATTASGSHINQLNLTSGRVLQSLSDSYLSSTEFLWMEWQATNTAANGASPGFGPAITDGSGNLIILNTYNGGGAVEFYNAAGNASNVTALPSNPSNTTNQHTFALGILYVDASHTRVVGYMDGVKLCDVTMNVGWVTAAYPAFFCDNGATIYISSFRTFTSTLASIYGAATIDAYGLLTTTQAGEITVIATDAGGTGITGSTVVTITDPQITAAPAHMGSVTITPKSATVQAGSTQQFTATVLDQYGNPYPDVQVVWAVKNTAGAGTIDAASGLFTAQIAGAQITVSATAYALDDEGNVVIVGLQESYVSESATAAVVVVPGPIRKITLSPSNTILQLNQSQQFTAYGYDSYGNQLVLSSAQWSVAGGIGTVNSSGFFTASTSGVGKVIASQNGISGSASANVLAVVGGVTVTTVPQQPFARIHLRDVVDQPLIVDARVRGGGLRDGSKVNTQDDFWWDLSRWDGLPFYAFGVYAISIAAPAPQLTPDVTAGKVQDIIGKFAAPAFIPVLVPGSAAPASSL